MVLQTEVYGETVRELWGTNLHNRYNECNRKITKLTIRVCVCVCVIDNKGSGRFPLTIGHLFWGNNLHECEAPNVTNQSTAVLRPDYLFIQSGGLLHAVLLNYQSESLADSVSYYEYSALPDKLPNTTVQTNDWKFSRCRVEDLARVNTMWQSSDFQFFKRL